MTMRIRRREFLSGVAAAGAVGLIPDVLKAGQAPSAAAGAGPARRIIDTHYHYGTKKYGDVLRSRNTGQTGLYDWDATKALEDMDKYGVATSMMSVSEPGTHFGDDMQARALSRDCNDYAAKLMADHPGRFGLFAILPLPDVEGALKEIEYAYDTLKADGIAFMTSYPYPGKYQGNKYLGDPMFVPVMQELNRRKAVCYTHPFRAEALINTLPDRKAQGFTLASDTTLTILSILENETAKKFPDIRFIWSHGGGTMPYITGRLGIAIGPDGKPNERMEIIRRFYYDTAQLVMPWTLNAFTTLIPNSQVTFGSDYLGNPGSAGNVTRGLEAYKGFTPEQLRAIYRDNALRLFPRLAKT